MALQAAGGGGTAMMNAPMNIPGGGLMPQQAMPRFSTGAPSASHPGSQLGPMGDPRAPVVEVDEEALHGGDACLCVEFGGSTLSAAAWDATKKTAVALSVGDKGETVTSTTLRIRDTAKLKAWLAKPAKTRAAEAHTAGVDISGKDEANTAWATITRPGALIGPVKEAKRLSAHVSGGLALDLQEEKDDDDDDFGLSEYGERIALKSSELKCEIKPETCLALLAARPRQRATQLVSKPVRRMTIVGPASASMAWRLAAADGPRFVDARCTRFISAPLAQIAGAVLRLKKSFSPGDIVVSAILEDNSIDAVIASCEAASMWFTVTKTISTQTALESALKTAACFIVRGDATKFTQSKDIIQAEPTDAVTGAATLAAARLALPGAPSTIVENKTILSRDALPYPVVLKSETGKEEVIFDAGTPLPASCRREYSAVDYGGGVKNPGKHKWPLLTLCERVQKSTDVPCGAGLDDPFETIDDEEELVYATDATVEFFVDARGLASSQVIFAKGAPKSAAKEARDKAAKRCRRLALIALALFLLTPVFYTLIHMRKRAVVRGHTIAALEDFYQRAKPDKLTDAADIADKYEGFEDILFKRLERQYPGFTVNRDIASGLMEASPGEESPPDASGDDDAPQEL